MARKKKQHNKRIASTPARQAEHSETGSEESFDSGLEDYLDNACINDEELEGEKVLSRWALPNSMDGLAPEDFDADTDTDTNTEESSNGSSTSGGTPSDGDSDEDQEAAGDKAGPSHQSQGASMYGREVLVDRAGKVITAMEYLSLQQRYPVQVKLEAKRTAAKKAQKSAVKGARQGKLAPGEKKKLRKEKIEAKRAVRAAHQGMDFDQILDMLDEFVSAGRDMSAAPFPGKQIQPLLVQLARLYGVRASFQGSGKKRILILAATSATSKPAGAQLQQVERFRVQDLQQLSLGRAAIAGMCTLPPSVQLMNKPRTKSSGSQGGDKGPPSYQTPVAFVSSGVMRFDHREQSSNNQAKQPGIEVVYPAAAAAALSARERGPSPSERQTSSEVRTSQLVGLISNMDVSDPAASRNKATACSNHDDPCNNVMNGQVGDIMSSEQLLNQASDVAVSLEIDDAGEGSMEEDVDAPRFGLGHQQSAWSSAVSATSGDHGTSRWSEWVLGSQAQFKTLDKLNTRAAGLNSAATAGLQPPSVSATAEQDLMPSSLSGPLASMFISAPKHPSDTHSEAASNQSSKFTLSTCSLPPVKGAAVPADGTPAIHPLQSEAQESMPERSDAKTVESVVAQTGAPIMQDDENANNTNTNTTVDSAPAANGVHSAAVRTQVTASLDKPPITLASAVEGLALSSQSQQIDAGEAVDPTTTASLAPDPAPAVVEAHMTGVGEESRTSSGLPASVITKCAATSVAPLSSSVPSASDCSHSVEHGSRDGAGADEGSLRTAALDQPDVCPTSLAEGRPAGLAIEEDRTRWHEPDARSIKFDRIPDFVLGLSRPEPEPSSSTPPQGLHHGNTPDHTTGSACRLPVGFEFGQAASTGSDAARVRRKLLVRHRPGKKAGSCAVEGGDAGEEESYLKAWQQYKQLKPAHQEDKLGQQEPGVASRVVDNCEAMQAADGLDRHNGEAWLSKTSHENTQRKTSHENTQRKTSHENTQRKDEQDSVGMMLGAEEEVEVEEVEIGRGGERVSKEEDLVGGTACGTPSSSGRMHEASPSSAGRVLSPHGASGQWKPNMTAQQAAKSKKAAMKAARRQARKCQDGGGTGASPPSVAPDLLSPHFGAFEAHTTGIGSKLLMKMGWREGMGLGRNKDGITEPLLTRSRPKQLGLGAPATC